MFYQSIPLHTVLMWFAVFGGLMLLNEVARSSKWMGLFFFLVLPIVLPFTIWRQTAAGGSSVGDWFHWAKMYSCLAGCLGFMALRFIKGLDEKPWALAFPPLILAINIFEAVIRDFECFGFNGVVDGMMIVGGPWNIMNGIAGLLNIITITGWMGIFIGRDKKRDMLYPDMLWFWIIAYDIWNFAYTYNCLGDHSFYCGFALLLSCTIPAFFIRKGAWLQHRAQTLALWVMFAMTFPNFIDHSKYAVKSANRPEVLFAVSFLALVANLAVFVFYLSKIIKNRKNPLKEELYTDLKSYQAVAQERKEVVPTRKRA